jgi:hypothetical protein
MQRLPTVDSTGYISVCTVCASEPTSVDILHTDPPQPSEKGKSPGPVDRFRHLLDQSGDSQPESELPEELLEDLPEEARELLSKRETPTTSGPTEELSEDLAASLRDQGYVISQDIHGVRLSGSLSSSRSDSGPMSPYDIVRIAADLEGGVLPLEQRNRCSKCDAVIPVGDKRCQWCGQPALPEPEPEDQD